MKAPDTGYAQHELLLEDMQAQLIACRLCPRLVAWREEIAQTKIRRYADETYWGRPVPSFGDPNARVLIVGLAPAAHGGNRTGRVFTGDRSGDWLYRALHRAGFANQPTAVHRDDGLVLTDCYITAVAHCAPPANKLLPAEVQNCHPYLVRELQLLSRIQVIVALGKVAFDAVYTTLYQDILHKKPPKRPAFAHGVNVPILPSLHLIGSYHPSQQNTFTGKLTEPMFDAVFAQACALLS